MRVELGTAVSGYGVEEGDVCCEVVEGFGEVAGSEGGEEILGLGVECEGQD